MSGNVKTVWVSEKIAKRPRHYSGQVVAGIQQVGHAPKKVWRLGAFGTPFDSGRRGRRSEFKAHLRPQTKTLGMLWARLSAPT